MRVLLLDASDRGGIATFTDQLAEGLAGSGLDVRLAAPGARALGAPALPLLAWGGLVPTSRWRLWGRRAGEVPRAAAAVVRAVVATRPDVVHVHTELVPRLDAPILGALSRRVPVVVSAHDPVPHEGGLGRTRRDIRLWRSVDAVIVHGDEPRRLVETHAAGATVRVVPVDLRLGGRPLGRAEARQRLSLADAPTALLLGLLRSYKGLDLLAEAWPAVVAERSDARLLVVGAAYGHQPALDRLRELPGVEVREGFVPEDDIDAWAAAADILVLPYRHGAHSGVLHRGLAAGTPVLASPSLSDEVERTGAGRTIPLVPGLWATALAEALGPQRPPAPPPPSGRVTLETTIAVYREVLDRRKEPKASGTTARGAGVARRPPVRAARIEPNRFDETAAARTGPEKAAPGR